MHTYQNNNYQKSILTKFYQETFQMLLHQDKIGTAMWPVVMVLYIVQ